MEELQEETSTAKIYWDSKNEVAVGKLFANISTLDAAVENIDAQERVRDKMNKKQTRVLIDMSVVSEISKDARDYFANERTASIQRATALYITSSIGKVIGNFFMGLNKPITPTKLFTDKEEAIKWLQTYSNE